MTYPGMDRKTISVNLGQSIYFKGFSTLQYTPFSTI